MFVSMKKSTLCDDAFVAESRSAFIIIFIFISCTYMCTRIVITVKSLHNNIATGFCIHMMHKNYCTCAVAQSLHFTESGYVYCTLNQAINAKVKVTGNQACISHLKIKQESWL